MSPPGQQEQQAPVRAARRARFIFFSNVDGEERAFALEFPGALPKNAEEQVWSILEAFAPSDAATASADRFLQQLQKYVAAEFEKVNLPCPRVTRYPQSLPSAASLKTAGKHSPCSAHGNKRLEGATGAGPESPSYVLGAAHEGAGGHAVVAYTRSAGSFSAVSPPVHVDTESVLDRRCDQTETMVAPTVPRLSGRTSTSSSQPERFSFAHRQSDQPRVTLPVAESLGFLQEQEGVAANVRVQELKVVETRRGRDPPAAEVLQPMEASDSYEYWRGLSAAASTGDLPRDTRRRTRSRTGAKYEDRDGPLERSPTIRLPTQENGATSCRTNSIPPRAAYLFRERSASPTSVAEKAKNRFRSASPKPTATAGPSFSSPTKSSRRGKEHLFVGQAGGSFKGSTTIRSAQAGPLISLSTPMLLQGGGSLLRPQSKRDQIRAQDHVDDEHNAASTLSKGGSKGPALFLLRKSPGPVARKIENCGGTEPIEFFASGIKSRTGSEAARTTNGIDSRSKNNITGRDPAAPARSVILDSDDLTDRGSEQGQGMAREQNKNAVCRPTVLTAFSPAGELVASPPALAHSGGKMNTPQHIATSPSQYHPPSQVHHQSETNNKSKLTIRKKPDSPPPSRRKPREPSRTRQLEDGDSLIQGRKEVPELERHTKTETKPHFADPRVMSPVLRASRNRTLQRVGSPPRLEREQGPGSSKPPRATNLFNLPTAAENDHDASKAAAMEQVPEDENVVSKSEQDLSGSTSVVVTKSQSDKRNVNGFQHHRTADSLNASASLGNRLSALNEKVNQFILMQQAQQELAVAGRGPQQTSMLETMNSENQAQESWYSFPFNSQQGTQEPRSDEAVALSGTRTVGSSTSSSSLIPRGSGADVPGASGSTSGYQAKEVSAQIQSQDAIVAAQHLIIEEGADYGLEDSAPTVREVIEEAAPVHVESLASASRSRVTTSEAVLGSSSNLKNSSPRETVTLDAGSSRESLFPAGSYSHAANEIAPASVECLLSQPKQRSTKIVARNLDAGHALDTLEMHDLDVEKEKKRIKAQPKEADHLSSSFASTYRTGRVSGSRKSSPVFQGQDFLRLSSRPRSPANSTVMQQNGPPPPNVTVGKSRTIGGVTKWSSFTSDPQQQEKAKSTRRRTTSGASLAAVQGSIADDSPKEETTTLDSIRAGARSSVTQRKQASQTDYTRARSGRARAISALANGTPSESEMVQLAQDRDVQARQGKSRDLQLFDNNPNRVSSAKTFDSPMGQRDQHHDDMNPELSSLMFHSLSMSAGDISLSPMKKDEKRSEDDETTDLTNGRKMTAAQRTRSPKPVLPAQTQSLLLRPRTRSTLSKADANHLARSKTLPTTSPKVLGTRPRCLVQAFLPSKYEMKAKVEPAEIYSEMRSPSSGTANKLDQSHHLLRPALDRSRSRSFSPVVQVQSRNSAAADREVSEVDAIGRSFQTRQQSRPTSLVQRLPSTTAPSPGVEAALSLRHHLTWITVVDGDQQALTVRYCEDVVQEVLWLDLVFHEESLFQSLSVESIAAALAEQNFDVHECEKLLADSVFRVLVKDLSESTAKFTLDSTLKRLQAIFCTAAYKNHSTNGSSAGSPFWFSLQEHDHTLAAKRFLDRQSDLAFFRDARSVARSVAQDMAGLDRILQNKNRSLMGQEEATGVANDESDLASFPESNEMSSAEVNYDARPLFLNDNESDAEAASRRELIRLAEPAAAQTPDSTTGLSEETLSNPISSTKHTPVDDLEILNVEQVEAELAQLQRDGSLHGENFAASRHTREQSVVVLNDLYQSAVSHNAPDHGVDNFQSFASISASDDEPLVIDQNLAVEGPDATNESMVSLEPLPAETIEERSTSTRSVASRTSGRPSRSGSIFRSPGPNDSPKEQLVSNRSRTRSSISRASGKNSRPPSQHRVSFVEDLEMSPPVVLLNEKKKATSPSSDQKRRAMTSKKAKSMVVSQRRKDLDEQSEKVNAQRRATASAVLAPTKRSTSSRVKTTMITDDAPLRKTSSSVKKPVTVFAAASAVDVDEKPKPTTRTTLLEMEEGDGDLVKRIDPTRSGSLQIDKMTTEKELVRVVPLPKADAITDSVSNYAPGVVPCESYITKREASPVVSLKSEPAGTQKSIVVIAEEKHQEDHLSNDAVQLQHNEAVEAEVLFQEDVDKKSSSAASSSVFSSETDSVSSSSRTGSSSSFTGSSSASGSSSSASSSSAYMYSRASSFSSSSSSNVTGVALAAGPEEQNGEGVQQVSSSMSAATAAPSGGLLQAKSPDPLFSSTIKNFQHTQQRLQQEQVDHVPSSLWSDKFYIAGRLPIFQAQTELKREIEAHQAFYLSSFLKSEEFHKQSYWEHLFSLFNVNKLPMLKTVFGYPLVLLVLNCVRNGLECLLVKKAEHLAWNGSAGGAVAGSFNQKSTTCFLEQQSTKKDKAAAATWSSYTAVRRYLLEKVRKNDGEVFRKLIEFVENCDVGSESDGAASQHADQRGNTKLQRAQLQPPQSAPMDLAYVSLLVLRGLVELFVVSKSSAAGKKESDANKTKRASSRTTTNSTRNSTASKNDRNSTSSTRGSRISLRNLVRGRASTLLFQGAQQTGNGEDGSDTDEAEHPTSVGTVQELFFDYTSGANSVAEDQTLAAVSANNSGPASDLVAVLSSHSAKILTVAVKMSDPLGRTNPLEAIIVRRPILLQLRPVILTLCRIFETKSGTTPGPVLDNLVDQESGVADTISPAANLVDILAAAQLQQQKLSSTSTAPHEPKNLYLTALLSRQDEEQHSYSEKNPNIETAFLTALAAVTFVTTKPAQQKSGSVDTFAIAVAGEVSVALIRLLQLLSNEMKKSSLGPGATEVGESTRGSSERLSTRLSNMISRGGRDSFRQSQRETNDVNTATTPTSNAAQQQQRADLQLLLFAEHLVPNFVLRFLTNGQFLLSKVVKIGFVLSDFLQQTTEQQKHSLVKDFKFIEHVIFSFGKSFLQLGQELIRITFASTKKDLNGAADVGIGSPTPASIAEQAEASVQEQQQQVEKLHQQRLRVFRMFVLLLQAVNTPKLQKSIVATLEKFLVEKLIIDSFLGKTVVTTTNTTLPAQIMPLKNFQQLVELIGVGSGGGAASVAPNYAERNIVSS
ncbi:unnamed protein product [Amoebophrya sp. A120]|nr:unnamed protein product [Amoebophrya sp. A120]|eukprot:GSA120T00004228001.1